LQPSRSVDHPSFERAREGDLGELLRIHTASFPDPRGRDPRVANFVENPLGGFDRLFVLRGEDGLPVAHAFLFRLEVALAGAFVPFGGVASVGVAPERRGQGLARALLEGLHAQAARESLLGTFLYAFRQGFYRRFGYGRTGLDVVIDAHPASFPAEPSGARVRPARSAGDFAAIEALHEASLLRGSLGHRRSAATWARLRGRGGREWLLAESRDRAVGYAWADRGCTEAHAHVALAIGDLVAEGDAAERAIFSWISAQRDQVQRVVWQVPAHAASRLDLVDPDRHRAGTESIEHAVGTMALGPMVRLGDDLGAFLRTRRWPASGSASIALVDAAGHRAAAYALRTTGEETAVEALPPNAAADLEGTAADLASLLAGGVALRDLPRVRLNSTATAARTVDLATLFALPPTHVTDAF
jgi:predicted acetyltransferase